MVVTGASSGIGEAVARALGASGAKVMLGARRTEKLEPIAAEITAGGGEGAFRATDLRDEKSVDALIDGTVERFGRIDAIVNNAAYGVVRTIADGRLDEWRGMVETNILGTLCACRAALRHMLPRGEGTILNVTSASAGEAWPYLSVYAGTKAAVHTLSRGLRAEVAGKGIRVLTTEIHNVGGTDFASTFDHDVLPEAMQRWTQLGLLSRESPMLAARDAARAIVFQLSQPDPVSVHHLVVRSRAN